MTRNPPLKFATFLAVHLMANSPVAYGAETNWQAELARAEQALKGRTTALGNPLIVPDIKMAREILLNIVKQAPVEVVALACEKLLPILDDGGSDIWNKCVNAGKETGKTGLFTKATRLVVAEKSEQSAVDPITEQLISAALASGDFKAALALSRRSDIDPKVAESYRKQAEMLAMRSAATDPSAAIYIDHQTILVSGSVSESANAWARLEDFATKGSKEAIVALREIAREMPAEAPRAAKGIFAAAQAGSVDAALIYVAAHVDDLPIWTDETTAAVLASQLAQTGRTLDLTVALQFSIRNGGTVTVDEIGKRIAQSAQGDADELLKAARRLEETHLATPSELALAFELAERSAGEGSVEAAYWAPLLVEKYPEIAGDGRWQRSIELIERSGSAKSLDHAILLAKLKLSSPFAEPDLVGARAALEAISESSRTAQVWHMLAEISEKNMSVEAGKTAAELYTKAIKLGSSDAAIKLAVLLLTGRPGINADPMTAQRLLDGAASSGQSEAMMKLAKAVASRDPDRARYLYLRALQNGDARAGLGLSAILESSGDLKAARKALEQAAAFGDPEMIAALAAFLNRTNSATPDEIEEILDPVLSEQDVASSALVLAASTILRLPSLHTRASGLQILEKLAQKQEPDAIAALARYHVSLTMSGTDISKAEVWARKASQLRRPGPLVDLAKLLLRSQTMQDQHKAVELLQLVLETNPSQTDANRLLGDARTNGATLDRDLRAAFKNFEAAALGGSVGGQLRLARAYETGSGTEIDTAKAIEFYTRAANSGSLNAMRDLGRLLVSDGPYSDPVRGFQHLFTAAKAGQVESQTEVGRLLISGVGMVSDKEEGLRWLQRGAEGGDPGAMIDLFHHYRREASADKLKQAIVFLETAAAAGSNEAMSTLATMYRDGDMVGVDQDRARQWFKRAADKGDLKAARASRQLALKLEGAK